MFSVRLNQLLDERNISAYRLAKDTEIPERLVGYWKKGEKLPGLEKLIVIADYFNVSIDYLAGRTDKPEVNE